MSIPAITVHISGADVSAYVDADSLAGQLRMNARGTANFLLRDATRPAIGAPVQIYEDAVLFWSGIIAKITEGAAYDHTPAGLELAVDCVSNEAILDDRIIEVEVYESTTAGAILTDLLTTYLADDGFSAGTISDGATITKLVIDHRAAASIIDDLAKLSDFVWYADENRAIHFRAITVTAAPYSITDASPHVSHISVARDGLDYANELWRRVGWPAFGQTEQTFHGDGATRTWPLDHPPALVERVTLGGSDVTFGRLDVDTGRQYYWSDGSTTITQDAGETLLVLADDLVVYYRELGSDCIYSCDQDAIIARGTVEGTSGHHGRLIEDTGNTDAVGALATNEAQLAQVVVVPRVVEFAATDVMPRPAELITINLSVPQIVGDFVCQEVGFRFESGFGLRYAATATDVSRYGGWQEWVSALRGTGGGSVTISSSTSGDPIPSDVTPPDAVTIDSATPDVTGPDKARLTVVWTPGVILPTYLHFWLEVPDRSAGEPIILDGTALLDGSMTLAGRPEPEDLGTRNVDGADPQPIVLTFDHVAESTPCRIWVVSGVDGAENTLAASPSATFTLEPPAPRKPDSATAYGPCVDGLIWIENTVGWDDGTSKTYTWLSITGVPITAPGFLGFEIVSGDWPDDPAEYIHTGLEVGEGAMSYPIENPTPASVMTVTFWARTVYAGPNGEPLRNPIVRGVTPSVSVTFGTTVGTIDLSASLGTSYSDAEFMLENGKFVIKGVDLTKAIADTISSELQITGGKFGVKEVSAAKITAGTLAAGVVYAGAIAANQISAGTLAAGVVYAGSVLTSQIGSGTLPVGVIYAGNINCSQLQAGTIAAAISMTSPTLTITGSGFTVNIDSTNAIKITASTETMELNASGLLFKSSGSTTAVMSWSGLTFYEGESAVVSITVPDAFDLRAININNGYYKVDGVKVVGARQARPTTLTDVINVLIAHGLTA